MNDLKVALRMLPLVRGLYKNGVIDITTGFDGSEYIQLNESKFRSIFPDIEPDDKGYLVTFIDGVEVIAVTDEAE